MSESMQEHHIQKLTHHRTAVFERRNIRSACYDFASQNCLNTECVSTRVPSGVPKSPKWIYPLWAFYYVELGCAEHHIQKLTHHCTAVFERRNIRSVCCNFASQNCLNTKCVSTRVPSGVPKTRDVLYDVSCLLCQKASKNTIYKN